MNTSKTYFIVTRDLDCILGWEPNKFIADGLTAFDSRNAAFNHATSSDSIFEIRLSGDPDKALNHDQLISDLNSYCSDVMNDLIRAFEVSDIDKMTTVGSVLNSISNNTGVTDELKGMLYNRGIWVLYGSMDQVSKHSNGCQNQYLVLNEGVIEITRRSTYAGFVSRYNYQTH